MAAAVADALALDLRISGRVNGRRVHAAFSDLDPLELAADIVSAVRTPIPAA